MKIKVINEDYPDWIWQTRDDPRSPVYSGPEPYEKKDTLYYEFHGTIDIVNGTADFNNFKSDKYDPKEKVEGYYNGAYLYAEDFLDIFADYAIDKLPQKDGIYEIYGIVEIPITVELIERDYDEYTVMNVDWQYGDTKVENFEFKKVK